VDKTTTQLVRLRARDRCEYCHLPEAASDLEHVIDHIIARQHGGSDEPVNLALCCVRCNQHKGPNIAGLDPEDRILTPLYNPRSEVWGDHFSYEGPILVPKAPSGARPS
jgi:hypothetical protein